MIGKTLTKVARRFSRSAANVEPQVESLHFDVEAFQKREVYRPNYAQIGAVLLDLMEFTSVLDLGCANCFLLEYLADHNKCVQGVELSSDVLPLLSSKTAERVTIGDAVTLGKIGSFDLVCCVEVAEHIPPECSENLLDTIISNANTWIYFTAASPFQPGHGHINCRQQFYWLNEFRKRGVTLDWERTEELLYRIRGLSPAKWLEWNSLILRKA